MKKLVRPRKMNRTASAWAQATPVLQGTSDTRIGKIEFDLGFLLERVKLGKEFSKTFF
jgi:hypothetical protein